MHMASWLPNSTVWAFSASNWYRFIRIFTKFVIQKVWQVKADKSAILEIVQNAEITLHGLPTNCCNVYLEVYIYWALCSELLVLQYSITNAHGDHVACLTVQYN